MTNPKERLKEVEVILECLKEERLCSIRNVGPKLAKEVIRIVELD